jgi:hypothetical protein
VKDFAAGDNSPREYSQFMGMWHNQEAASRPVEKNYLVNLVENNSKARPTIGGESRGNAVAHDPPRRMPLSVRVNT